MEFRTVEEAQLAYKELQDKLDAAEKDKKNLEALKGKLGRRIGELEETTKRSSASPTTVVGDDMTDEEAEKMVAAFSKNPRRVIKEIFTQLNDSFDKRLGKAENSANYLHLIKKYPEFDEDATQMTVIERQQQARLEGRELTTVDVLEKMRLEKKEAEITSRETKLKEGGSAQLITKEGVFGAKPGSGSDGESHGKAEPTEAEAIVNGMKNRIGKDGAPF